MKHAKSGSIYQFIDQSDVGLSVNIRSVFCAVDAMKVKI